MAYTAYQVSLKKWQDRLADHHKGTFTSWIKQRRTYSRQTAYKAIWAFECFGGCKSGLQRFPEANALYLLSAPKTPDSARDEAIAEAEKGETITHKRAKEIVERHKPPKPPTPDVNIRYKASSESVKQEFDKMIAEISASGGDPFDILVQWYRDREH